jgi:hypothetical protein
MTERGRHHAVVPRVGRPPQVLPDTSSHAGALVHGVRVLSRRGVIMAAVAAAFVVNATFPIFVWLHITLTQRRPGAEQRGGPGRWARLLGVVGGLTLAFPGTMLLLMAAEVPGSPSPMLMGAIGVGLSLLLGLVPVLSLGSLRRHLGSVFRGETLAGPASSLRWAQRLAAIRAVVPAVAGSIAWFFASAVAVGGTSIPFLVLAMAVEFGLSTAILATALLGGRRIASFQAPREGDTTPRLRGWLGALDSRPGLTVEALPIGWVAEGAVDGRMVLVDLDTAHHPARLTVSVHLPVLAAVAPQLVMTARGVGVEAADAKQLAALHDPVMSRLLAVEGVEGALANALVDDLHEELLGAVQGLPGSRVEAGALVLVADLWPSVEGKGPELTDLVQDALDLAEGLELRAEGARVPTPGTPAPSES